MNTLVTTRAKFRVESVTDFGPNAGKAIKMRPVYNNNGSAPENAAFWEATPNGSLEMTIKSEAADLFVPGEEYYLDFTPAG